MESEKQKSDQLISALQNVNQSMYNDISYYGYPAQSEDTPAKTEENVNEKTNDVDSSSAKTNTGFWQDFSSSTSMHGLRLTGDSAVQKWRRLVYISFLVYLIYLIIKF